jgi:hypothetical protein
MNRRQFLKHGTLIGSAFAFGAPRFLLNAAANEKIYLGLVTYNLARSWDIPTIIQRCAAHGFERVELRSTHAHGVEPDISIEKRKEVRKQFEDSKVDLISLGSACEYHSTDPDVVKKNIDETKAFIRLASDVGAKGVKVRPNGLPKERPIPETLAQIGQSLRTLGQWSQSEGFNIELWLEVHGGGTSHVPYIKTIMEEADHPLVGVTWNCNGSDLIDGSCRENWMLVHRWVRTLHIHDLWDENQYPWKELFTVLGETNWSGNALWERGGESDDPDALMEKQHEAFVELIKLT